MERAQFEFIEKAENFHIIEASLHKISVSEKDLTVLLQRQEYKTT